MRTTLVATIVSSIIAMSAHTAAQAAMRRPTNIPPEPLATALRALVNDRDLQMVYSSELLENRNTRGATGDLTMDEALAQILSGTGLTYRYLDDQTVTVVPASGGVASGAAKDNTPAPVASQSASSPDGNVSEGTRLWDRFRLAQVGQSSSAPVAAPAQSTSADAATPVLLEEVVVTAQKRAERLQDVPISIAVLSGHDLDNSTFVSTKDTLATVPGLATLTNQETGGTMLSLRGVSSTSAFVGGSTPIAYYVDGVPFGLVRSALVPDADVYDLQRIEVLSGPQGTLYGASALNGVVRIITNDPDMHDYDFKGRAMISTTDHGGENYDGDMAANIPIIDGRLAMRIVAGEEHQSGWINTLAENHSNDVVVGTERVKLNAQATDTLSLGLSAWHSEVNSGAPPVADSNYVYPSENPQSDTNAFNAYGLTIKDDLKFFSVSSTASYIAYSNSGIQAGIPSDGDPTVSFFTDIKSRIYSEELNLTSKLDGPWKWSWGFFYRNAEDGLHQTLTYVPQPPIFIDAFADSSKSEAVYGELGRSFFDDALEFSAGVRYFHDIEATWPNSPSQFGLVVPGGSTPYTLQTATASATTPRAILTWKPSNDLMAYLSYGQGFRSGFPQDYLVQAQYAPAAPDKLTNYEIGIKGDAFDQRLAYTIATYYIHWTGVQQQLNVETPSGINLFVIANGQSASGPGTEFSLAARPVKGLELATAFSWNDLTFDHTVYSGGSPIFLAGDRLNVSPEFTASFSASYTFPLSIPGFQAQISASENYTSVLDSIDIKLGSAASAPSNSMLIARAKISVMAGDRWVISAFADNLANYNGIIVGSNEAFYDVRTTPRTVGMKVDYHLR